VASTDEVCLGVTIILVLDIRLGHGVCNSPCSARGLRGATDSKSRYSVAGASLPTWPSGAFLPEPSVLSHTVVQMRTDQLAAKAQPALVGAILRSKFFAALFVLGCANGLAARIGQSLTQHDGLAVAVLATFKISIIIFAACIAGVLLIYHDRHEDASATADTIRTGDVAVAAVFMLLVAVPIAPLSWLAVMILSLYILFFTDSRGARRRGVVILLATTVPMFWSPLLFDCFARIILIAEASAIGTLLGTHRTGNIVEFADRSGMLVIYPGCSSLANVSLAILCWITLSQCVHHKWSTRDLLWCGLIGLSVVVVNVLRVSLMGLNTSYYYAIHNAMGDAITNMIIFGFTVGISILGLRREIFPLA